MTPRGDSAADTHHESTARRYPDGLLPSLRDIHLVCPLCRRELSVQADAYECRSCQRVYGLHAGIPDFRVFPDPYLSVAEDHARTDIVLQGLETQPDLESLLEFYWSFSDVTPIPLRKKFVRSAMVAGVKAKRIMRTLADTTFVRSLTPETTRSVLDIGAGTGGFVAAATARYETVVGTDIAMRWLHVSRRRYMDLGVPVPPLVCCCAEHLPFPDGAFDLVVAAATIEFVRDQDAVLEESARVLSRDGSMFLQSVNRYALSGDPYVYLWGVGFLPRAWQARYVRWRRDASYENIRLLSHRELHRMAASHFRHQEYALPDVDAEVLERFPVVTRAMVHVYRRLKRLHGIAFILRSLGPGWDVKLSKS